MHDVEPLSQRVLDAFLAEVEKPARYIGGEVGSVIKSGPLRGRLALCFPDVYEVGESHLGLKILYHVVNATSDFAAERVYTPWPDFEQRARLHGVPLFSLETRRPLHAFDVIGFTLQYELAFGHVVSMLDHGGVAVRAQARGQNDPFVIGGGACACNPEPVAPFFDAFLLGDGEEAIVEILAIIAAGREQGAPRQEILQRLGELDAVYVPAHFAVEYAGLAVQRCIHTAGANEARLVRRRAVADLDKAAYPVRPIVANIKPVHDRLAVEVQRGCSRNCRFCQAGMTTRPTRQRRLETVLQLADDALRYGGACEVGLLSLSAGDYGPIHNVLQSFRARYAEEHITVALPSLRTETMTPELAEQVAALRSASFTLAPEAGSERLRRVINKCNTEADLLSAVRAAAQAGFRQLKLYFMIGLPTETDADVDAIATLAELALEEGRKIRPDVRVTVAVSTFVPKPHTPFQWERQIGLDETVRKQERLRQALRARRIPMRHHAPEQSFLEGVLARGDRRLADAIEAAARAGCRFDAWSDHYQHHVWMEILEESLAPYGLRAEDYLDERALDSRLCWDHLHMGVDKRYLVQDRARSRKEQAVDDCALSGRCYACGACDLAGGGAAELAVAPALKPQLAVEPRQDEGLAASAGAAASLPVPSPQSAPAPQRYRFRYGKRGGAVYLSHLEVMEHVLRAVRQAKVPVLYSQGYAPRPRISFSPACPTGVESEAEYFDAVCAGAVHQDEVMEQLNRFLPQGITVVAAQQVRLDAPSLDAQICAMTYRVRWGARAGANEAAGCAPPPIGMADARDTGVQGAIERFFSAGHYPVEVVRKGRRRQLNARESVLAVTLEHESLRITLAHEPSTAGIKVAEAVALFFPPELSATSRICKAEIEMRDLS